MAIYNCETAGDSVFDEGGNETVEPADPITPQPIIENPIIPTPEPIENNESENDTNNNELPADFAD